MTARTLKQLLLVALTLMSATAFSGIPNTDVPLPGTKMRLRDTSGAAGRRTYAALRDGDQSVPVPDPRITGATASIGRVGAGEVTVLDLPASGWSGGTSVRRDFKFKSRSGAVVSARLIGGRSIRISARGDGAYPLDGTPQGGVGIIIDVGGVRFCGFFGGTIVKDDGERFVARKAPAAASCPILGTTTTTSTTTTSTTTSTTTTTLGPPVTITSFSAVVPSCADGVVNLTASATGGTEPYVFTFKEGDTTLGSNSFGQLVVPGAPGSTYSVTATDSVGSTGAPATASATVAMPLTVSISETRGDGTVDLSADASGGISPYSFVWSTGATTPVITVREPVSGAATYTVTVIDSFGCSASTAFTVSPSPT